MKATVLFVTFLMCVAFGQAQTGCPPVPCPAIEYPKDCRTVTFFVQGKNQVCQGCDQCIKKVPNRVLDENGCPLRPCTLQLIPERCRRDVYYIYRGRTVCKDCPQDTCRGRYS